MPGAINKRKMDAAWDILVKNPGIHHKLIALEIQKLFNMSKPPLRTTVTNWICLKRKEIKREKLKEYARGIAINILRRDFCRYCQCRDGVTNRCCFGYETEVEVIDLLREKVFCDYYQAPGKLQVGSLAGLKTECRID